MRRILACVIVCLSASLLPAASYDYAELLQHGLYFYEAQEAGELSPGNRVVWRGPSTLDDGQDVGLDLSGGWYDAGDHWKMNRSMSQAASFLAWSVVTFPDVYRDQDQMPHALNSLRHIVDYLDRCIVDDNPENADDFSDYTVYVDIGGKSTPTEPTPGVHNVWSAPEVIDGKTVRQSYAINADTPNGAMAGAMAGALASAAQVLHLYGTAADQDLAARLLPVADKLAAFGIAHPAPGSKDSIIHTGAVVVCHSIPDYPWDALIWSQVWLHRCKTAMGVDGYEAAHLQQARGIIDGFSTDEWNQYKAWWKELGYNHASLLAWLQTDHTPADRDRLQPPLQQLFEIWNEANENASPDTSKFYHTPYGLKFRWVYGSSFVGHRVFRNTALAAMYAHWVQDQAEKDTYTSYVQAQTDYYLGDNKQDMSYIIGFGDQGWPITYHHRGAQGPWASHDHRISSKPLYMQRMRHVLYGALLGGPDKDDDFTDGTWEHTTTEPIIGAAGEVQIVAAFLTSRDPGAYSADPDFPPAPERDLSLDPEWTDRDMYVAAAISGGN
ncbi:MAG: glycoside hydrolase family 9 protein, partial [Planctomycetota bacterium]